MQRAAIEHIPLRHSYPSPNSPRPLEHPITAISPRAAEHPLHPLGQNGNGFIVIPRWFVSFLSLIVSVVFAGAAMWAWQISSDVSAIKAEVRAQNELRRAELEDIRRRLARHEELLDRLQAAGVRIQERRELP